MKPISRTISTFVALLSAGLFLAPSPVSSNELSDFVTKFTPTDPCDWSGTSRHFTDFQENEIFLETIQQSITAETLFHSLRMVETRWNGFIGGRLGFCWNRFLFYGTGGVAFTDVQLTSHQSADTAFFGFIGDGEGEA